jgi:hypothetical protein
MTKGRTTPEFNNSKSLKMLAWPIAASTKLYPGQLVGLNSTGFLVAMSATTGLICVGVAWYEHDAILTPSFDNSTGGDGAFYVTVRRGVQFFHNSTGDAVVVGDTLGVCYAEDDMTVCHTGTSKSATGIVIKLTDGTQPGDQYGAGVWVDVGVPTNI